MKAHLHRTQPSNCSTNLFIIGFLILSLAANAKHVIAQTRMNSAPPAQPQSYAFINGQWFDGRAFTRRTFYSVGGILTTKKPRILDKTIDLANGYVVPPFADAHTHNLDGISNLERTVKAYLSEGTFYVQVLANSAAGAKQARPLLNKPSTLDVSYANGMLTCTYGHPFMVYEPLAMGIYNPANAYRRISEVKQSRRAENNAYWFLDSKQDVDAKWEKILSSKPDIIKIALLDAENYEGYVASGNTVDKGLSPEVAEYVVRKAHQAGLRVYAHIETANVFRLGLKIGVDGFAHAPYYGWNGSLETKPQDELTIKDLKLAARKRVVVVPTARRSTYGTGTVNQERFERIVARHKKLFNEMHKNGVRLAFGLDIYGTTLNPELWYFHDNKIFDNLTLLKLAVEATPQTIFPQRKIGRLRGNYEASFLVLDGNPLADFAQVKNIRRRFKQGFEIVLPDR